MALDLRISSFAATTSGTPASDLLEVVKDPAGSPDNFKMTWANFGLLAIPDVYAAVYKSDATTLTNGVWTALPFDTEIEDDYGFHEGVTNPSRLTVPSGYGGIYVVTFGALWLANVSGLRAIRIYLNGTTNINRTERRPLTATLQQAMMVGTCYPLNAGNYIEGQVYQNRGGDLDVNSVSQWSSYLTMIRVGR